MITKHFDDTVDRLMVAYVFDRCDVCKDAADEIERLRQDTLVQSEAIETLRALVRDIYDKHDLGSALDARMREALGE